MIKASKTAKTAKITFLLSTLFCAPAIAHTVRIAGDVAGTWHIDPNENPRAGEPAKVWIALTWKGGKVLQLEQADCQLAVYSQPRIEGDQPILQPQLKAIAVEQYQKIPAADLVFPAPGLYEMNLRCMPKTAGTFETFEMQSEATVAGGTSQASPVPAVAQSPANSGEIDHSAHTMGGEQPNESFNWQGVILWVFPLGLGLGLLKFLLSRSPKSPKS